MAQGTVKWFNDEKGYGFISPDESNEDLFVHHTGIAGNGFKSLEEGAKVSYEATRGKKGMQADNVTPQTRTQTLSLIGAARLAEASEGRKGSRAPH
jgi:CspA family cold shock protein